LDNGVPGKPIPILNANFLAEFAGSMSKLAL